VIKKKGRGGARKNAGRKKVVKDLSWIKVGARCEYLQKELATEAALKRYESLPRTKLIREAQSEIVKQRYTTPLAIGLEWIDAGIKINKPGVRAASLKIKRIATRKRIAELVSDEYFKLGYLRMTPRRVRECWDRYRQLLALRNVGPAEEISEADLIALQTPS
jgi:hypothetical protein